MTHTRTHTHAHAHTTPRSYLHSWSPRKNIGHVTSSNGTIDIFNIWLIKYLGGKGGGGGEFRQIG